LMVISYKIQMISDFNSVTICEFDLWYLITIDGFQSFYTSLVSVLKTWTSESVYVRRTNNKPISQEFNNASHHFNFFIYLRKKVLITSRMVYSFQKTILVDWEQIKKGQLISVLQGFRIYFTRQISKVL
jgi:hypothetical protein